MVPKKSLEDAETRSNYVSERVNKYNGLRVKFMHTMAISELTTLIFISVAGLSKHELPKETCSSRALLLKVPGLTIGGGGCTVNDERLGFFLCTEK